MCELDDSSDDEGDKCDNLKSNEYWSEKLLDYAGDLNEEDNYDKNLMTNDEMSGLIGG